MRLTPSDVPTTSAIRKARVRRFRALVVDIVQLSTDIVRDAENGHPIPFIVEREYDTLMDSLERAARDRGAWTALDFARTILDLAGPEDLSLGIIHTAGAIIHQD